MEIFKLTKHEKITESWGTFWHGAAFRSDGTSHSLVSQADE
jgi:hypothetical protein